jgi:hypothetical protein
MTACKGCNSGDDADGDGFSSADDCDDEDPNVNPDAIETCNGVDDDCANGVDDGVLGTFYADLDADTFGDVNNTVAACSTSDGVVGNSADCDDTRNDVNPNAVEACNGIDDNCNTQTDEGVLVTVYADADGDGYGDADQPTEGCGTGNGVADNDDDCNDGDADINPAADEHCDAVDENCDNLVDNDAVDAATWYHDTDGDGYGDPNAALLACAQPLGYVSNDTDCDDTRNRVNVDAVELCNTLDDDCNGLVDDNPIDSANWYLDNDADAYGTGTPVVACEAPSVRYVLYDGDCNDVDPDINPVALEVCDGGVDNDCDATTDEESLPTTPYWMLDNDSDGFGDQNTGIQSCSDPGGGRIQGTQFDCDDQDPAVNPNATEICARPGPPATRTS